MISRSLSAGPSTSHGNSSKNKDHGSIRLYSSDSSRSTVATLTLQTTAGQIAENYKVDSLYVQTGNFHIRRLSPEARPLELYATFIGSIGFDMDGIRNYSSQEIMKNIIAFYLSRPTFSPSNVSRTEVIMEECDVRRGRFVHKWSRSRCILYNGGIRILRGTEEREIITLGSKRVDIYESRRGRCLRIQDVNSLTLILFEDEETLHQWLYQCQQNVQSISCDLSDRRLTLLPDTLFNSSETVRKLNLRRNSLSFRKADTHPMPGYLEDLYRLRNLIALDLSYNNLTEFPLSVTDLPFLESLNLSSNRIENLPGDIGRLKRITTVDISNNRLSALPNQLVECVSLRAINLTFNQLTKIPLVLTRLDMVTSWQLAGNYIENVDNYSSGLEHLQRIDLRRNNLEATFRLPVGSYDQLFHIDLRDNQRLSVVYLTNTPALRVILCSRLQLTSIHLNGQSLTHLFVDHNLLDSLVVMPIPSRLQVLDVSHNLFDSLPEWICDLESLTAIRANHNRILALPSRIFCLPSLRLLCLFNNELSSLPPTFEDSALETLLVQSNCLQELPSDLFKALSRLRQLNVSFNELKALPFPSPNADWNKLQVLRAAHNQLDESVVPQIVLLKRLKVLDLSNNKLRYFDDSALNTLTLLEDLNISSNLVASVSSAVPQLPALTHFRAHSNAIQNMPELSQSLTIQLVDLSSNQISFFPPSMASAPALKSLDVSCNPLIQIDSGTISRSRRKPVSVVDVSLSTNKLQYGYSETTGNRSRLYIRRVCKKTVFGLVDGGSNYDLPKNIMNMVTKQIEEMEEIDLKKIFVSTHLNLGESGQQLGASLLLTQIQSNHLTLVSSGTIGVAVLTKGNISQLDTGCFLEEDDYITLRKNGIWLDENNLINGVTHCPRQIGMYHLHPTVAPNPVIIEGVIEGIDTIIIASKSLWDHLNQSDISRIANSTMNPQVAAKRLQDAVQSCDYLGNLSVIVMKLPKPEIKFDSPISKQSSVNSLQKPLQVTVPVETPAHSSPTPKEESRIFPEESFDRLPLDRSYEDDSYLTGRQLYDKILADEIGHRSPSSLSGAPPDPSSDQEAVPDLPEQPTPTPRSTSQPPTYQEFRESQKYALGYARSDEGQYNVAENARRIEEKAFSPSLVIPPISETNLSPYRPLGIIREVSESTTTELAMDEPSTFSFLSIEQNPTLLTPMEEALSSRYRFEYARSSIQENLKLSRSSSLDL